MELHRLCLSSAFSFASTAIAVAAVLTRVNLRPGQLSNILVHHGNFGFGVELDIERFCGSPEPVGGNFGMLRCRELYWRSGGDRHTRLKLSAREFTFAAEEDSGIGNAPQLAAVEGCFQNADELLGLRGSAFRFPCILKDYEGGAVAFLEELQVDLEYAFDVRFHRAFPLFFCFCQSVSQCKGKTRSVFFVLLLNPRER